MSPELALAAPPDAERRTHRNRLIRGGAVASAFGILAFLLMAEDGRLRAGVPLGAVCVTACAYGLLDLLGRFRATAEPGASEVDARALAKPAAAVLGSTLAVYLSLWAAVHGALPEWVAGALLTVSFIVAVASVYSFGVALGPLRTDEDGNPRPLLHRHGFWLLVAMAGLYLPALGLGGLIDPWETHYGEVAREVLARDDWISTWWSWEGFFYSKPVLGIWMQSIAMATLGVHVEPGRMMEGLSGAAAGHPEWAVRMPFVLFAMMGTYLLYKGTSRWFGRRAGMLGALVLSTCPQWFMVAHQSMTDMPFVASLAGAMGLVLFAARHDDSVRVSDYDIKLGGRTIRVNAWHLVLAPIIIVSLAQILYLLSRNIELVLQTGDAHGFRLHADEIHVGSGLGNCTQPGDPACSMQAPVGSFEPWGQALMWAGLLVGVVALSWKERRTKRLIYLAAWVMAALSTMAKGPAGLAIPVACIGVWIGTTGRWREVPQMALGPGLVAFALLVGPWWIAMLVRHGSAFTDELIFHDIYNRAFDHVHDTNTGFDTSVVYYIEQLGYGLFPWIALVPLGLFLCFGRKRSDESDAAVLLFAWFGVVFTLFSAMGTKFHHYILPAVPPVAMLVGVTLDWCLGRRSPTPEEEPGDLRSWSHFRGMVGACCLTGAFLAGLVARDLHEQQARLLHLFTYRYDRIWPDSLNASAPLIAAGVAAALLAAGLSVTKTRRFAALGCMGLALVWACWVLDRYMPEAAPHWGQRSVIEAYYAKRKGPEEPIVAYLLNWKGENFYTGNRIAQFGVPTPPPNMPTLPNWVKEQKEHGVKAMFFVTEQHGVAGLKKELSTAKDVHEVTTREDSNQFVLVRAEL